MQIAQNVDSAKLAHLLQILMDAGISEISWAEGMPRVLDDNYQRYYCGGAGVIDGNRWKYDPIFSIFSYHEIVVSDVNVQMHSEVLLELDEQGLVTSRLMMLLKETDDYELSRFISKVKASEYTMFALSDPQAPLGVKGVYAYASHLRTGKVGDDLTSWVKLNKAVELAIKSLALMRSVDAAVADKYIRHLADLLSYRCDGKIFYNSNYSFPIGFL